MPQGYVYRGSPASMAARTGAPPAQRFFTLKTQVPLQHGQTLGFTGGRGYYAKPATSTPPAGAATGTQSSDQAAATAMVKAIFSPVIAQITNAEKARASQGQSLINGYTNNAVDQLKGLDFGAPYQQAEGDQNAVNTALLARLGNQGSALQNQLQGELGTSVGAPATGAVVGRVGADATGAGNAGLAKGDATLSSLINQGAAAKTYGSKLPGIETLAGLQDAEKLQGAVNTDQANQLSSIESKVPSMVQSELGALASARTAQQKNEVAALIAAGKTKEALQVAKMNDRTRASIANANNQTKTSIAAANAGKISSAVSKVLGYAATADGTPIRTKDGKIIPVTKTGQQGTPKVPTAQDISKLVTEWKDGTLKSITSIPTKDGKPLYTDSNGNPKSVTQTVPTGQLNYGRAYARLRAMGVTDQVARQYLNSAYQKGEQGRSWVTNTEQTALKKAGLPTKAAVLKAADGTQRGVLTQPQYQALKAVNQLPAGTLTADGHYVISPGY